MSSTDESDAEEIYDLSNSDVVTKHKAAAEICNNAMAAVVARVAAGVKVTELISIGNQFVEEYDIIHEGDEVITMTYGAEVLPRFSKGKMWRKGLHSQHVSVSISQSYHGHDGHRMVVRSVVGHYCPVESAVVIQDGDLVKIDLGCHIDGFIAIQAGSVVVQEDMQSPIKARMGDLLQAVRTAHDAALRLIRPGKSISGVSQVLGRIAEIYGCTLVEGVLSHQLKRFVIDGNKCILSKPTLEHKVDDDQFEENEVYAVDIVMSTGDGKMRIVDEKETMIYKRALDREYNLRMKASRTVFAEINRRFPTMPFTIAALPDEKQVRLGLVECLNHGLLHPYPVLHEKQGEFVAQLKSTVLLMPSGSDVITKFPEVSIEPTVKLEDPEIIALLEEEIAKKRKPRKKK